jgi:hypothetical protein
MILIFLFDEEWWTVERVFISPGSGRNHAYLNMQAIPGVVMWETSRRSASPGL